MSRSLTLLTLLLAVACEGTAGKNGVDGTDGTSGTDGTDGTNGTDGADGTDGTDGADGTDGTDGADGEDLMAEPSALDIAITGVEVGGAPVVTFTVANEDGDPYNGLSADLLSARALRFTLAKLVPGEDGDGDAWQSYINTTEDTSSSTAGPGGAPALASAVQATSESGGALTYLGGGTYTYTFATDITAVTSPLAVDYEPELLHRVAMQIEFPVGDDGDELIYNPSFDWVPSGADAPATHDVVSTDSCNECHSALAVHGGGRMDVDLCVTCHNPGTTDANSGESVDMRVMIHKIHMGADLPSVGEGTPYTIWGYRDSENDYSYVSYPQDQTNCLKCHNPDDAATPDAGLWSTRPTMEACGSCHDTVDFALGEDGGHDGGVMTDNATCVVCHTESKIEEAHVTSNATPNNPGLPDDVVEIAYEILSASVDADDTLTVTFQITSDGDPLDLSALPSDLSSAPSFMLAYAGAQDGYDAPQDYNNLGKKAGQPATVSLSSLVAGSVSGGTYAYDSATGVSTMVYASAFPSGAMMRAVALQGYYTQTVDGTSYARHAKSVLMPVDGDDTRRVVVDNEGCAGCHEWVEGHGGNRVYETGVCVMCHNPSLSSSGRELNLDNPEASNNFKDLIHGIHGSSVREYPLDFVRNRSGGLHYTYLDDPADLAEYPDGTVVTYPTEPSNCLMCHLEGTYMPEEVNRDMLPSTTLIGDEATTTTEVSTLRTSMPNATDWIIGPTAAACSSCHNGDSAMAHMDLNGGTVLWTREEVLGGRAAESCDVCHGDGRTASTSEIHGL